VLLKSRGAAMLAASAIIPKEKTPTTERVTRILRAMVELCALLDYYSFRCALSVYLRVVVCRLERAVKLGATNGPTLPPFGD